jgi:hypothetical protein
LLLARNASEPATTAGPGTTATGGPIRTFGTLKHDAAPVDDERRSVGRSLSRRGLVAP